MGLFNWLKQKAIKEVIKMEQVEQNQDAAQDQATAVNAGADHFTLLHNVFSHAKQLVETFGEHLKEDALRYAIAVVGDIPGDIKYDLVKFYDVAKALFEKDGNLDAAVYFAGKASAIPAAQPAETTEQPAQVAEQPEPAAEPEPAADPAPATESEQAG